MVVSLCPADYEVQEVGYRTAFVSDYLAGKVLKLDLMTSHIQCSSSRQLLSVIDGSQGCRRKIPMSKPVSLTLMCACRLVSHWPRQPSSASAGWASSPP